MLTLRRPSGDTIRRLLEVQSKLDFSYAAVGATATTPPSGYVVDHTRIQLGQGEAIFTAAKLALTHWRQFHLGWVEAWLPDTPIKEGEVVGVLARVYGHWWLNAARIVYVVDEAGPVTKFGFAYGTLPGHAESGEERFLIEWHHADNSVWYDILAFSRPKHFMIHLTYPMVRRMQKRFGRESAAAMVRAVSDS